MKLHFPERTLPTIRQSSPLAFSQDTKHVSLLTTSASRKTSHPASPSVSEDICLPLPISKKVPASQIPNSMEGLAETLLSSRTLAPLAF